MPSLELLGMAVLVSSSLCRPIQATSLAYYVCYSYRFITHSGSSYGTDQEHFLMSQL